MIRQGDGRGPSSGGFLSWTPRFLINPDTSIGGGEGRDSNCYVLFGNPGEEIGAEHPDAESVVGFWDDVSCGNSYPYICERTIPPNE